MPVSVVVGGQYGSEGKGKAALEVATRRAAAAVVRVGGPNSGHTAVDPAGRHWALRQLPASILAPGTVAVLPAGAIVDPDILLNEISRLGLGPDRVRISPSATLVTAADRAVETDTGLTSRIGSTGSGTGAALARRMRRDDSIPMLAEDNGALAPFFEDTTRYMRDLLNQGRCIVIEGTQGYGLSLLRGAYPKVTSRDTTAGTFIGEAGLSPLDVDDVTLVIRTFPIRVAGASGPLPRETTWREVARRAGLPDGYHELTTATRKVRRVGEFDAGIVREAIAVNGPTRIVLNHLDYVDPGVRVGRYSREALAFLSETVEKGIGRRVDWVGVGPAAFRDRATLPDAVMSK